MAQELRKFVARLACKVVSALKRMVSLEAFGVSGTRAATTSLFPRLIRIVCILELIRELPKHGSLPLCMQVLNSTFGLIFGTTWLLSVPPTTSIGALRGTSTPLSMNMKRREELRSTCVAANSWQNALKHAIFLTWALRALLSLGSVALFGSVLTVYSAPHLGYPFYPLAKSSISLLRPQTTVLYGCGCSKIRTSILGEITITSNS